MIMSDKYLLSEVYGEYILFPIGQSAYEGKQPIKINDTGAVILKLLENDLSFDELFIKFKEQIDTTNYEDDYIKKVLCVFIKSIIDKDVLLLNNTL